LTETGSQICTGLLGPRSFPPARRFLTSCLALGVGSLAAIPIFGPPRVALTIPNGSLHGCLRTFFACYTVIAYRSLFVVINRQSLLLWETWHVCSSICLCLVTVKGLVGSMLCVRYGISHSAESSINQGVLAITCHSRQSTPNQKNVWLSWSIPGGPDIIIPTVLSVSPVGCVWVEKPAEMDKRNLQYSHRF
jgi:hypothetical protein